MIIMRATIAIDIWQSFRNAHNDNSQQQ